MKKHHILILILSLLVQIPNYGQTSNKSIKEVAYKKYENMRSFKSIGFTIILDVQEQKAILKYDSKLSGEHSSNIDEKTLNKILKLVYRLSFSQDYYEVGVKNGIGIYGAYARIIYTNQDTLGVRDYFTNYRYLKEHRIKGQKFRDWKIMSKLYRIFADLRRKQNWEKI